MTPSEVLSGSGLAPGPVTEVETPRGAWTRIEASFTFRDLRGSTQAATAALYLPPAWQNAGALPLIHVAGYELTAGPGALLASHWMTRDVVISNPLTPEPGSLWPGENPLARGINLDAALLHRVRTLPIIDDEKVVVTGWSAGGAMTCLLAAETFPIAGAFPQVALMDIGWVAAALTANQRFEAVNPNRSMVAAVFDQIRQVLGDDEVTEAWLDHSPAGVLDQITCPVLGVWSTADGLVPIDHIDSSSVRPGGVLTADAPSVLGEHRPTLVDRLGAHDLLQIELPAGLPEIRPGAVIPPPEWGWVELPSGAKAWTVCVTDEGPTQPWIDHLRWACLWTSEGFLDRCLSVSPGPEQLTPAKLERLVDRYTGTERRSHGLVHLDDPEMERADVLRGLGTFARTAANRRHLIDMYAALPRQRRALGEPEELDRRL